MMTTIIFDAEGVVIDTQKIWEQADIEFLSRRNISTDIKQLHSQIVGTNLVVGSQIMQQIFGFPGNPEKLAEERYIIVKELFSTKINFVPGFLEFYKQIKDKYKISIATALKKELMVIVNNNLHLTSLFSDHIYHITDVGNLSKPSPAIFLYAAQKLGSNPNECVVIEDAPNGISGAKRAGMKCIALTTTFHKDKLTEADIIVEHFKNINLDKI